MNNPKEGNRIILLGLAIALAIAALFAQWGVITLTAEDLREGMGINGQRGVEPGVGDLLGGLMSAMMSGMSVPVSGQDGSLALGPLKIPYWLAIAAVVTGLVFTFTNSRQLSAVPRALVMALLVSGIVAGAWAIIVILGRGTVGIGAFLLIAASVIGLTRNLCLRPS